MSIAIDVWDVDIFLNEKSIQTPTTNVKSSNDFSQLLMRTFVHDS